MHRFLSAVVVFTVVPALAADPKSPNYYPLTDKNTWEYRLEVSGMRLDATAELRAENRDNKTVFVLESRIGQVASKEELMADAKGVYRTSFNGIPTSKPVMIFQYPAKPATWSDKVKIGEAEVSMSWKQGEPVEVAVPAGKFRAVPVELTAEVKDQKITATTWYVDGVGIVKQSTSIAGVRAEMELTKFTPGK